MRVIQLAASSAIALILAFVTPIAPAPAQPELPLEWYFAEGTTRDGFFEYLSLQNPENEAAEVEITFMTNEGEIGPFPCMVPPLSRGTVMVNGLIEEGLDVSARVKSDRGLVAERPMYFTYKGVWEGGHVVLGVTETADSWYFAEGTTREGFEEWLCIQNPQDFAQDITVNYYTSSEVQVEVYRVAASHRFTVDVNAVVKRLWPQEPERDVSVKVEAGAGIIAERPIYFNYRGDWAGGHAVMGETQPGREWYLAEGYCFWNSDTYLCFLNPGFPTAEVTINYRRADGVQMPPQTVYVPGLSRITVSVNDVAGHGEFSFHIRSDQDIVVERPMYFSYRYVWEGGHDNMAVSRPAGEWYLAEGATWHGIETYLCILNPLDVDQRVVVEYLMEDRGHEQAEFIVPANTRYTRNVNADIGMNHDVSFRVLAFRNMDPVEVGEIVVERPMYFLYGGTMPGGHVASGYPE